MNVAAGGVAATIGVRTATGLHSRAELTNERGVGVAVDIKREGEGASGRGWSWSWARADHVRPRRPLRVLHAFEDGCGCRGDPTGSAPGLAFLLLLGRRRSQRVL
ncbi:MYXO-CTERM sorting domain-containing protein [Nannocystis pusilla]|uniref:MYXO-CTERM sorting domain-containing protein n=1 Tax=Nannocystis pusilla TaxID=889268 RepID=UPI003B78B8B4